MVLSHCRLILSHCCLILSHCCLILSHGSLILSHCSLILSHCRKLLTCWSNTFSTRCIVLYLTLGLLLVCIGVVLVTHSFTHAFILVVKSCSQTTRYDLAKVFWTFPLTARLFLLNSCVQTWKWLQLKLNRWRSKPVRPLKRQQGELRRLRGLLKRRWVNGQFQS